MSTMRDYEYWKRRITEPEEWLEKAQYSAPENESFKEGYRLGRKPGCFTLLSYLFNILLVGGILVSSTGKELPIRGESVAPKSSITQVVHEYLDLNENGLYDCSRVVFECDGKRKIEFPINLFEEYERTREKIEKEPHGGIVRFLKK